MVACETAIQEAVEKLRDTFCYLRTAHQKPETGYGYIERQGDDVILERKPNQVSARDFIAKGNFLNSGMFCFKADGLKNGKASILKHTANQKVNTTGKF
jgi:mannose-1-phosphate guanylyltransferase